MRVVKEAEERRNEILDAAEKLFGEKGFDATSTNDILKEVGIARGTLYYHFKSKENILDAMIERITGRLIRNASEIAGKKELPVMQRLTLAMLSMNMDNALGHEIMKQVHKPQNALMHRKMQDQLLKAVVPLVTGLVEEGIEQGICHTEFPAEATELMMLYSNTAFDELADLDERDRQRKIAGFIYNTERVLGMDRGSMEQAILPLFSRR